MIKKNEQITKLNEEIIQSNVIFSEDKKNFLIERNDLER